MANIFFSSSCFVTCFSSSAWFLVIELENRCLGPLLGGCHHWSVVVTALLCCSCCLFWQNWFKRASRISRLFGFLVGASYVHILYLNNKIPDFGSFNDHLESGGTQLHVS
jgi:hypothetical protein